jgi:tetratricopeptide (TPR) repeat protein
MKRLILCFFYCVCFISCKSTVHLPIPGESTIKQNNIYSEYMSIGDAYLDLEKFDKAITYYQKAMVNKNLYWTAYYKLGRSYALSKKWKEAKKVYFDLFAYLIEVLKINGGYYESLCKRYFLRARKKYAFSICVSYVKYTRTSAPAHSLRKPYRISARPRQDNTFPVIPPSDEQDSGISCPGGRPLSDKNDSHP